MLDICGTRGVPQLCAGMPARAVRVGAGGLMGLFVLLPYVYAHIRAYVWSAALRDLIINMGFWGSERAAEKVLDRTGCRYTVSSLYHCRIKLLGTYLSISDEGISGRSTWL